MEKMGETIAGSRFLRDFCVDCKEPMRVAKTHDMVGRKLANHCSDCAPDHTRGDKGDRHHRHHRGR